MCTHLHSYNPGNFNTPQNTNCCRPEKCIWRAIRTILKKILEIIASAYIATVRLSGGRRVLVVIQALHGAHHLLHLAQRLSNSARVRQGDQGGERKRTGRDEENRGQGSAKPKTGIQIRRKYALAPSRGSPKIVGRFTTPSTQPQRWQAQPVETGGTVLFESKPTLTSFASARVPFSPSMTSPFGLGHRWDAQHNDGFRTRRE